MCDGFRGKYTGMLESKVSIVGEEGLSVSLGVWEEAVVAGAAEGGE